ncbi:MAG: hypothetical protein QUU85_16290, partial [Candidatus Eisenbacteria bacterium]|nr:hypothetical protein [Candidatus Eisenbacteria bacterium]
MAVRSRSARGALGGLLALLGSLGRSGLLGLPAVLAVLGGVAFAVAGSSPASAGYLSDPMVQGFIPEARAAGMGRAYVAVAEGPSGVWWNPGGLGLADGYWMTPFSLLRPSVFPPYGEEAFRSYGVAGRIRKVGVGLHLNRWHDESSRVYETTQSSFTLGAGVDVAELLRRRSDPALRWGIGASYKRNSEHNEGEGIHPNWKDAHAWDLDVGTLVRVERPVGGRHSFVAVRGAAMLHNLLDQEYGPNGSSMGQEGRYGAGVELSLIHISEPTRQR